MHDNSTKDAILGKQTIADKKDKNHKLLVLGSNFGAVEIVQAAKARGIYTIVTDYYDPSRSNAKKYADECWDISTTDTDLLADRCREAGVTAVTCGVSEFTSEMTFHLCDKLGLPKYCSWEAWSYARNKRKFKDVCIANNVRVAQDYIIKDPKDPEQTKGIHFPVVVKPIDCGGNSGVTFCNTQEELIQAFQKAREVTEHPETIICEQRLEGREYAAGYALANGEASLIDVFSMHFQDGEPTNVYTLDCTSSGILDIYLSEIDEGIRNVFKDAGFTDGFVWIELMHDTDGHLYVLETGYRLTGGMLPYTFRDAAGFDAVNWYLDCFLGIRHSKEDLPVSQKSEYEKYGVSYLLWNNKGGEIKELIGFEKIEKDNRIDVVDFIRKPGYKLHPYSLMGEILFTCKNREEAVRLIHEINDTIQVLNTDGENVLIYFTGTEKIF